MYIFVTPFFPTPTSWRGPFCYDFVKALAHQLELRAGVGEWKVLVFKEGDGSDYEIGGVKVHTFRARHLPSNIFPFLFKRQNQKSFLKKVETVICSTFNIQPSACFDIVEVCHGHTANYGIYPLALKKLNPRCKTLLHHHDPQSFGLNMGRLRHCWLYNLIQFSILRKMHEAIDCHIFISEMVKKSFLMAPDTSWTVYEDYKKQMRGLPYRPAKIKDSVILHNGVDKLIFKLKAEGKGEQRKSGDFFVIGCVGNFLDWKDQMTLIRAIKLNVESWKLKVQLTLVGDGPERKRSEKVVGVGQRKIKLLFVGSGPYLEECKWYAKKHNIDVEFLTEMRHEKLPDFYRSLDLFVLPSYFEGFGCVFTEAHSCGVPFITCEGQGMDDILVGDNSGSGTKESPWLCKPRDPEDLAKKIGDYISRVERGERVEQRLNEDQDINKLVGKFVEKIIK